MAELLCPQEIPSTSYENEFIKIEVNFVELPFFALSNQDASTRTELVYRATFENGERTWRVIPSVKYGFPTPFDRKMFRAIEYLINQRGFPVENPFKFSLYEIVNALNLERSGNLYQNIRNSLKRIVYTGIDSQGVFYSKKDKKFISDSFHIYDRVVFKNQLLPNGMIAETNYLFLGSWYISNLNAFYVRPMDFHFYRSLKSDIAGRLYELAGLKFYGVLKNRVQYWRPLYRELCDTLPIKSHDYISLARAQLKNPHEELLAHGFFAKIEWGDWLIRYYPGPRAIREYEHTKRFLETPQKSILTLSEPNPDLVNALINRGVSKAKATKLVEGFQDIIHDKIETFDWIKDYRPGLVRLNPAGFLVKMIEEDWLPPEEFMTKAQIEEEKQKEEEILRKIERKDKEKEYQEWIKMSPEEKIRGDMFVWKHKLRNEGHEPTQEETEAKKQELVANLPSDDEYKRMIFGEE